MWTRCGIDTFAKYAFCCPFQPGSADEKPMLNFWEGALGEVPNTGKVSKLRRLFFESHALCPQALRQKEERTDHTEPKILPLAEKVKRVNFIKQKRPGC